MAISPSESKSNARQLAAIVRRSIQSGFVLHALGTNNVFEVKGSDVTWYQLAVCIVRCNTNRSIGIEASLRADCVQLVEPAAGRYLLARSGELRDARRTRTD